MAKRLSEKQKEKIIQLFTQGSTLEYLSEEFNCTKLTISRNLKKSLGEKSFEKLSKNSKSLKKNLNKNRVNYQDG